MEQFNQREETRYKNNEFDNMPSIDYFSDRVSLSKNNTNLVNWQEVERICKEHGFVYTILHSTYGGSSKVLVYEKVNIDPDVYKALHDAKDYDTMRKMEKEAAPRYLRLHMCINELDLMTNLYFRTSWAGNCGIFGSNDVRRRSYSFGGHVTSWQELIDSYNSACYYTAGARPPKGVYLLMESSEAKIDTSYVFDDFTMESALAMAKEEFPKLRIEIQTGKRQCDGNCPSYQAIVVGSDKGQYGSMTFEKSSHGVVTMSRRAPLAGECTYKIKRDNLRKELREAIEFMI